MGHFKTGFAGNKNREINFLFEVEIARDQSGQLGFYFIRILASSDQKH